MVVILVRYHYEKRTVKFRFATNERAKREMTGIHKKLFRWCLNQYISKLFIVDLFCFKQSSIV